MKKYVFLFFLPIFLLIPAGTVMGQDPNPPGSPAWCADHCNPSPETNACNQSETYKFADCCREIANTGDPMACGWPDRGYCLDSQCASIPEDVNRQRCGGPKHSWCDLCTTNKCPGFSSSPVVTPTPTSKPNPTPTTAIKPTTPPTPPPTSVPVVVPTTPPAAPTSIMLPLPYLTVTVAPAKPTPDLFSPGNINQNNRPSFSFSLPSLPQLPNVQLPCVNLRLSVASANIIAQKPLSVLRNIFVSIRQMDKKMEKVIEEKTTVIIKKYIMK